MLRACADDGQGHGSSVLLAITGTHRQAELVRLALSSAAAHVLASVPCAGN